MSLEGIQDMELSSVELDDSNDSIIKSSNDNSPMIRWRVRKPIDGSSISFESFRVHFVSIDEVPEL
jgi:hypothetical protein